MLIVGGTMSALTDILLALDNLGDFDENALLFLEKKKQCIDDLLRHKDIDSLKKMLQDDIEQITLLKTVLKTTGEQLINFNNIKQYLS